ncbi:hypothetical protein NQ315_012747 [Exocentrus adspersus]|uniref:Endonuclease/exonuclease/phosphatase domain-containing protein n=1 Tax=Exocentrus adspersus TaxID=1586481 RepID=A0AAV8V7F0_9CUCU|nr:hypothetical protein NQ315_012747 [Exocentrus adspersus]
MNKPRGPVSIPQSRDLVAIKVTIGRRCYVLCSAYLSFESPNPPLRQLMELVEWCKSNNLPLIIGCDANAHHICCRSKDINQRGLDLLEFLNSSGLDILNRGTKPTFVTRNRQEVIDITISNSWSSHLVKNWHVSSEVSMSDHRYILFNLETDTVSEEREYRNPKLTVWSTYRDSLSRNVGLPVRPHTIPQIETSVENLTRAVVHAYEQSCPVRKARSRQGVPWWNPELLALRKKARALFNRAMRKKTDADWDSYKEAQRLLTGHGRLNKHLNTIGLSPDSRCRLCGTSDEDSVHVLCHCPRVIVNRHKHFGAGYLAPEDIREIPVDKVLAFARSTGLF